MRKRAKIIWANLIRSSVTIQILLSLWCNVNNRRTQRDIKREESHRTRQSTKASRMSRLHWSRRLFLALTSDELSINRNDYSLIRSCLNLNDRARGLSQATQTCLIEISFLYSSHLSRIKFTLIDWQIQRELTIGWDMDIWFIAGVLLMISIPPFQCSVDTWSLSNGLIIIALIRSELFMTFDDILPIIHRCLSSFVHPSRTAMSSPPIGWWIQQYFLVESIEDERSLCTSTLLWRTDLISEVLFF